MMGGKQPHGFTIFEAMLFLAISGIMLASAINLISGKQAQTEFDQGIHQMQNQLETEISHVSEGYYDNSTTFTCSDAGGAAPTIRSSQSGVDSRGMNFGCQYLGEAIQFAPKGNPKSYVIYPVAGAQYSDTNLTPVTTFDEAYPEAIALAAKTVTLPYGLTVGGVNGVPVDPASPAPGMVGFYTLTSTSNVAAGGLDKNANISVDLYAYTDDLINGSTMQDAESFVHTDDFSKTVNFDPPAGVAICFNSGSTPQSGIITIGANGNPTAVNLTLQNGHCT